MSEIGLRTRMLVKDVMSSPVVTTDEEAPSNKIAKLMDQNKFGCVIVTNEDGKPLGMITERDLVVRVLAKNLKPETVTAKDVMTAPLATIDPEASISDAARIMSRLDVRRLGVIYRGEKRLFRVTVTAAEFTQKTSKTRMDSSCVRIAE